MEMLELSNYGVGAIFISVAWKLYADMRSDANMWRVLITNHLEKQDSINLHLKEMLEKISNKVCKE
jgi:hypothetical protein